MDPAYLIVQMPIGGFPSEFRSWLDTVNHQIGGTAPNAENAVHTVQGENPGNSEPLRILDPTMASVNVLVVNSEDNAHFVAGALKALSDGVLSSWAISAPAPAIYR